MLLILCGPSGVGKTTLAHRLVEAYPTFSFSVSYTTRSPRANEKDGVDYHFVDVAAFEAMVDRGEFAEHARVHGNLYGTAARSIDERLAAKQSVLFDIDWQGARQLMARYPHAIAVMLAPPGWSALEARLRARSTDSEAVIERRLAAAREELAHYPHFTHVLVNDDLDETFHLLEAICRSELCRAHHAEPLLQRWDLL